MMITLNIPQPGVERHRHVDGAQHAAKSRHEPSQDDSETQQILQLVDQLIQQLMTQPSNSPVSQPSPQGDDDGSVSGASPRKGGGGLLKELIEVLKQLQQSVDDPSAPKQQLLASPDGGGIDDGAAPAYDDAPPAYGDDVSPPAYTPSSGPTGNGIQGPAGGKWDADIEASAKKYGVDPSLIKGIMAQESQGDPNAVSSVGATGLMQLKPDTASAMAGRPVSAEELKNDPKLNIELGTKYFAQMLQQKGGNVNDALGAYNQGPGANWQSIPESRNYVKNITTAVEQGHIPG